MGNGIASWPSNISSQQRPPSSPLDCLYPLPSGRNCWQKDLHIMITPWIACCTQYIVKRLATVRIIFPCILALNNTNHHQGCWPGALWANQGVFETLPGEGEHILCFICSCQSDWLLLEAVQLHTRSGLNRRHTAGRAHANRASLAVCQGFVVWEEGRGWISCACFVCVCVYVCVSVVR